mgnify:CR=1 FL=1
MPRRARPDDLEPAPRRSLNALTPDDVADPRGHGRRRRLRSAPRTRRAASTSTASSTRATPSAFWRRYAWHVLRAARRRRDGRRAAPRSWASTTSPRSAAPTPSPSARPCAASSRASSRATATLLALPHRGDGVPEAHGAEHRRARSSRSAAASAPADAMAGACSPAAIARAPARTAPPHGLVLVRSGIERFLMTVERRPG